MGDSGMKKCVALCTVILVAQTILSYNYWCETLLKTDTSRRNDKVSITTGSRFSGEVVRKFPLSEKKEINDFYVNSESYKMIGGQAKLCKKWAVLTTINDVTGTVRRQAKLIDWCLVIVADQATPTDYSIPGTHVHVVYLSVKEQEKIDNAFVKRLPWNNFGRKNIGYLYAIQHGAVVIWDFDDDNFLKEAGIKPKINAEAGRGMGPGLVGVLTPDKHTHSTFNPYPVLGAPTLPSWPRGIPPKDIKEPKSFNFSLKEINIPKQSIAVLQSLADVQPDVDAIYRLTMKIPFSFKPSIETRPIVVPKWTLAPYNAQATLHFKCSFWALLLPITVHARVSDIWRSYIAQRLFWDSDLSLGFISQPLVLQDRRNFHDNVRDLAAEEDLYQKGEQFVKFLTTWRSSTGNFVERLQELYIAMYERDYLEKGDVLLMQMWLSSLIRLGYDFPKLYHF